METVVTVHPQMGASRIVVPAEHCGSPPGPGAVTWTTGSGAGPLIGVGIIYAFLNMAFDASPACLPHHRSDSF